MVRKKRMTGIAARMILINLYMASLPKSFFGPTYSTGAGSRRIAYHYADKSPNCQSAIFARHYLSAADPHTVFCLATRSPGSRRSPHGTRHMVAKVVGSLGPWTHGSASWRCAGRWREESWKGTERALHRSVLISCDATSSTTEQGWPFLQLALWSLDDEFAEQSSALRSPSMC